MSKVTSPRFREVRMDTLRPTPRDATVETAVARSNDMIDIDDLE